MAAIEEQIARDVEQTANDEPWYESSFSGSVGAQVRAWALLALAGASGLIGAGCTDNQKAKHYGGEMTIELDAGREFVDATWKDQELWILTKDAETVETPETYRLSEKSSFGVLEGTVIIREHGAK